MPRKGEKMPPPSRIRKYSSSIKKTGANMRIQSVSLNNSTFCILMLPYSSLRTFFIFGICSNSRQLHRAVKGTESGRLK